MIFIDNEVPDVFKDVIKERPKDLGIVHYEGCIGVIANRCARDMSFIRENSSDLIVADHPYKIQKGTNRGSSGSYKETAFEYTSHDFKEKFRVLKDGCFLIEFLPETRSNNYKYIDQIIRLAENEGLKLFCIVPWFKAESRIDGLVDYSANVGRKGVLEYVFIFSKGIPRKLRQRKQGASIRLESGAKRILPAVFMHKPVHNKNKIHQSEKPLPLLTEIIDLFTNENEIIVDQFSGSLSLLRAGLSCKRNVISIEINHDFIMNSIGKLREYFIAL